MKDKIIKINESQLRGIISKVLMESICETDGAYYPMLGIIDTSTAEDICRYAGDMESAAAKFLHALINSGYLNRNRHMGNSAIEQWKTLGKTLMAIKKDCKKGLNTLNESTFFLGSDIKFPSNLASVIRGIAEKNGVTFEDRGDYISLSASFNDGFMYYTLSELYSVKMNKDGSLNYWRGIIGPNGAMHCYGPGYPDTAVHGQSPISEKEFLLNVKETIKRLSQYGK